MLPHAQPSVFNGLLPARRNPKPIKSIRSIRYESVIHPFMTCMHALTYLGPLCME